jgi:hypothetical protein
MGAPLTTEQLECLLDCVVAHSTHVLGVYPADCVPVQCTTSSATGQPPYKIELANDTSTAERYQPLAANQHYCFVVNTHPNGAPGEHWLAFFVNGNTRQIEYFDSFRFPLAAYSHVYLAFQSRNLLPLCVDANTAGMLQSVTSTVCGHYCVAFLYWRAKHTKAPTEHFARNLMLTANASANKRDALVVARLRAITTNHPCCSTQLFGGRSVRSTPRASQTCCCKGSCI